MTYWYMSFVDGETDVFLGSVVVKGRDEAEAEAMTNSHKLGANPGGQVAMVPLPGDPPPEIEANHYYPLEEMLRLGHVDPDSLGPNTRAHAQEQGWI